MRFVIYFFFLPTHLLKYRDANVVTPRVKLFRKSNLKNFPNTKTKQMKVYY